ncbi:aspartic peptidase domain-containing protein [Pholiota molesta]|nr:aspartic peptidase domain-containing protein [Pholiota molesta]
MHWSLWLYSLALVQLVAAAATLYERERSLDEIAKRYTRRTPGGIHLPLVRRKLSNLERRGTASAIGLGDNVDVAYTVLMTIGGITTPIIVDTGSSDLWVMSDACNEGCEGNVPIYPQASFRPSGLDVAMIYGDSTTGTFATGTIGEDTIGLAGLTLTNQYFAAINRTNTSVVDVGAAGIFGLGFPVNSVIWNNLFGDTITKNGLSRRDGGETPMNHPKIKLGSPFPNTHFRRTQFPTLPGLLGGYSKHVARQTTSVMDSALASYSTLGPFITRLVAEGTLSLPMISVTLQRDTIEVGGNEGVLSIGELPNDVSSSDLTWVALRGYSEAEGGLPAPSSSPNEVYPIAWEVMLDGVYFDGQKLPASNLSSSSIKLSALIDTGNSLIRGPSDVVSQIYRSLGTSFACNEPHTLAFQIGGKMFPVDPRDFIAQAFTNNVRRARRTSSRRTRPKWAVPVLLECWYAVFKRSVIGVLLWNLSSHPSIRRRLACSRPCPPMRASS